MNAKTTSAGDLQAVLAALQATQAIAAKTREAGKILGKVGGVASLALGSPEGGAGLFPQFPQPPRRPEVALYHPVGLLYRESQHPCGGVT